MKTSTPTPNVPNQVFRDPADKHNDAWKVIFSGRVQSPAFNSKGAAQAFLDGLQSGTRKQEVA